MKFNQEVPQKTEEVPAENLQETIEGSVDTKSTRFITDLISKTKEFLQSKAIDIKLGAMVVMAMGSMEVAQAQEGDISKFREAIHDVRLGKDKIENVVNSFYDSYKKDNIDSTYYTYEYSLSAKNSGLYVGDNKISNLIPVSLGDTVSLGDVDVKDYSVWMDESSNTWKDGKQDFQSQSIHKNLFGIKINQEDNNDSKNQKEKSHIGYGDSKEEAVILAMTEIARGREVLVTSISSMDANSERTSDNFSSEQKHIELSSVESHEVLQKVKVIVKKMSNREYHKYYEKGMISNKEVHEHNKGLPKEEHITNKAPKKGSFDCYSAEVIYSE